MSSNQSPAERTQALQAAVSAIAAGDFDATTRLLASPLWQTLEADFWNAEHPLPPDARESVATYLRLAKLLWHRAGLGQAHPIALYKTTLLSSKAIETALRVLARIYAGCNLGYCPPEPGLWRTIYALTGYLNSERFPDRVNRLALTNQVLQLWLMAWLNPLSLAPGRLPVAVRLVGILSKTCSFTLSSPTHAGSGLAAADLLSDMPPMPFARVPASWEPTAPLYINAQDAAFTMRELATPPSRNSPNDVYEALLQSATQVGLSVQEMQDFVRRSMREFGYSNARAAPRVGRADPVTTAVGFIECWGALQNQSKPNGKSAGHTTYPAVVINHSDAGFLLRYELTTPLLCVGAILCLRGNDAEPWSLSAVRWLEDSNGTVLVGCEVMCNFASTHVAQTAKRGQHLPIISFLKGDATHVVSPYDSAQADVVTQLQLDNESWVVSAPAEVGLDWQLSQVLDTTAAKREG